MTIIVQVLLKIAFFNIGKIEEKKLMFTDCIAEYAFSYGYINLVTYCGQPLPGSVDLGYFEHGWREIDA